MGENENSVPQVTVKQFMSVGASRLGLSIVSGENGLDRVIRETAINRPGLALAGFYRYFPDKRIQLIGNAEFYYVMSLNHELSDDRMSKLFSSRVPAIVYTRRRTPSKLAVDLANKYHVPLLKTNMITGLFANAATILLEELTAPKVKVHATMIEVAGIGVLIEGAPGIGKSETALGLIKRGYALVADDCTTIRRASDNRLIGSASKVTQYYMEIRGLGIIHVPSIYGVGSVRGDKRVDLVVTLERQGDVLSDIDRTGENTLTKSFHGIDVPHVIIPVAPGRDIVNIVETVAQEYKLRLSGQIAYQSLDERIKRNNTSSQDQIKE